MFLFQRRRYRWMIPWQLLTTYFPSLQMTPWHQVLWLSATEFCWRHWNCHEMALYSDAMFRRIILQYQWARLEVLNYCVTRGFVLFTERFDICFKIYLTIISNQIASPWRSAINNTERSFTFINMITSSMSNKVIRTSTHRSKKANIFNSRVYRASCKRQSANLLTVVAWANKVVCTLKYNR